MEVTDRFCCLEKTSNLNFLFFFTLKFILGFELYFVRSITEESVRRTTGEGGKEREKEREKERGGGEREKFLEKELGREVRW